MIKRLSAIAAVFFLLLAFINPAQAESFNSTKAIDNALQNSGFYQDNNLNNDDINYATTPGLSHITSGDGYSYGFLTYGQPHAANSIRNGQYRYIGYTYYGEDYTNMDYPADKNANGADFASQKWVREPWSKTNYQTIKASNPFFRKFPGDGSPEYRTAIQAGILIYGGANANNGFTMANFKQGTELYDNIEQYVHILAPPTQYAWGIGRMWHIENGSLWYVTVPIMPGALLPTTPDLSTNLETDKFINVQPGQKITSTVAYKLNQDHKKPERAWVRLHHVVDGQEFPVQLTPVNGAPVPDEKGYITLQPGDMKIYSYTFTVQDQTTKIMSRVNPVDTDLDKDWDNNRAEAAVIPRSYDIKVKIIPEKYKFTSINGDITPVAGYVDVTRKDGLPGEISVTGSIKSKGETQYFEATLGPGEKESIDFGFPVRPGTYVIEAEAWPVGTEDIYPPDNRDRVTISVDNKILNVDSEIWTETLR
ncbi:MAG: hypothetical protein JL50_21575 [Peptococcaceae bacterium BICA1-7]|nr:MAG: hypothetical protein JL50_21575 [Peptococcaceae bacterium BICA1-7]